MRRDTGQIVANCRKPSPETMFSGVMHVCDQLGAYLYASGARSILALKNTIDKANHMRYTNLHVSNICSTYTFAKISVNIDAFSLHG